MSVIGIIQARLGSTRLPGKILAPIAGRPMLELITHRLARSRVQEWWLATTDDPQDDITAAWGHTLGLRVYRGDTDNVLSRFTAIIREREPDWIVRATADNPFLSAEAVDHLLDAREEVGKNLPLIEFSGDENGVRQLPLGFGLQLARADAVVKSESEIAPSEAHHRAHVLSWLARHTEPKCCPIPNGWAARPQWRWTVDTHEDLAMARNAFAVFGRRAVDIGYREMVAQLDGYPDITAINRDVVQKTLAEG
ncbi:MAG: spore coat polysaccharide biosynthesis protein SpsF [Myxococcota bacterium]